MPPAGRAPDSPEAAAIARVQRQVSAIRGLPWKADLAVRIVPPEELERRVREFTVKGFEEDPARLDAQELVLKVLDLVPAQLDYRKTLEDLFAGGVLGFYDDKTKELFVKDDPGPVLSPAARSTLAHELTHALTDQHFGFGARLEELDHDDRTEESAAATAVIEGDAELVRALFVERNLSPAERQAAEAPGSEGPSPYAGVPAYLVRSLLFPYSDGLDYVEGLYRRGGFGSVDAAYRKFPVSTEEILHPGLSRSRLAVVVPSLPDVAARSGCTSAYSGTLGEFDARQVLREQLSPAESERAATGWQGDRLVVVRCPSAPGASPSGAAVSGGSVATGTVPGLVDRWEAESPSAAAELAAALARWSAGWSGSRRAPGPDGRFSGPDGAGRVLRAGNRVDIVLARDAATADRLVSAIS